MTIEEAAAEEAVLDRAVHERCIKQLVQTVNKRPKFLFYPVVIDLCTAEIATKSINLRDTNPKQTHI